jgi:hypothetical protein
MPPNPYLSLPLHLYENKKVLPRIYFSSKPVFWKGSERDLLIKLSETKDFETQTFIECASCATFSGDIGLNKIKIEKYSDGQLAISVQSENGGWLVFSESNIPGWVATVDSARTQIYTANYLFQSVFVPAGSHSVEFNYIGPLKLELEKLRARL